MDRVAVGGLSLRGTRFRAMAVHVEIYGTGRGFFFRRVREIANTGHVRRVSLSVRMEQLGSHFDGFLRNLVFGYFSKHFRENS